MFDFLGSLRRFAAMYGLEAPAKPQLFMRDFSETRERLVRFKKILLDELNEVDVIVGNIDASPLDDRLVIDLLVDITDWLADIQVYAASELTKYGVNNNDALRIVMESNFSKLGADGKAIMKDGKVQKGPNYWKPEPKLREMILAARQTPKQTANDVQVGGSHYKTDGKPEHWDLVAMYGWDYFQGQITKYLMRWKHKHTNREKKLEDLKKSRHFLDKYIEEHEKFLPVANSSTVTVSTGAAYVGADKLSPAQQQMYDYLKSRVWADETFSCEGWKADMALFQHRVTKQEFWARDLPHAHELLAAAQAPGAPAKQPSSAGSEPSSGYVDQG